MFVLHLHDLIELVPFTILPVLCYNNSNSSCILLMILWMGSAFQEALIDLWEAIMLVIELWEAILAFD